MAGLSRDQPDTQRVHGFAHDYLTRARQLAYRALNLAGLDPKAIYLELAVYPTQHDMTAILQSTGQVTREVHHRAVLSR